MEIAYQAPCSDLLDTRRVERVELRFGVSSAAASACFDPRRAGNHVHLGEVGLPAQRFPIEGVASLKRLHTRSEANRPEVEETL
jgi:hypothetical protein